MKQGRYKKKIRLSSMDVNKLRKHKHVDGADFVIDVVDGVSSDIKIFGKRRLL